MYASLNRVSIGSDNGLSPIRRQAIILTNAGLLSIGPLGINFSEISIKIRSFSFMKMHLKLSSAKRRPFCPGGDGLIHVYTTTRSMCHGFSGATGLIALQCCPRYLMWNSELQFVNSIAFDIVGWYMCCITCDALYDSLRCIHCFSNFDILFTCSMMEIVLTIYLARFSTVYQQHVIHMSSFFSSPFTLVY